MTCGVVGKGPQSTGTSFIGSFVEEPDQAVIVLRGDIDAFAVSRVGAHISDVWAAGARYLMIDAAAVDSYHEALLDLLGRTQSRLAGRRGMLQVRGLHPSLLAGPLPALDPVLVRESTDPCNT